jgi:hypothetical protein
MTDVPLATPVATPDVLLTVATPGMLEVQLAVATRVVPSLYVAVATNCWVPVIATEAVAGVTAIDVNVAAVTVSVAVAVWPPKVAVMTDVPLATPVATPDVLLTVATPGVPEVQPEYAVTSRDDPSAYVAVAVNGWVSLTGIVVSAGVTAMETTSRIGEPPKIGSFPLPLHPATKAISSNAINHISGL